MSRKMVRLNPNVVSGEALEVEQELYTRIIGQDRAIRTVARALQVWRGGLSPRTKPIANLLFLGPTGVGKTHLVEALADIVLGSPEAVIKIDCAEFQRGHEVSKLLGSPPGYVGGDRIPRLTNESLSQHHKPFAKISFVLFDEIEKAHEDLFELLLGILDKATLTLGNGEAVDFSQSMVFLTSNLASREMSELTGGGLGFAAGAAETDNLDKKIYKTAVKAAGRHFSPEFMNRLDRTVVFHSLQPHHFEKILDVELRLVQERITMQAPWERYFILNCLPNAKKFLLREGIDPKYGARALKRTIERYIIVPLSNFLTTDQINLGDIVTIGCNEKNELVFMNEIEGALIKTHNQKFPIMIRREQL